LASPKIKILRSFRSKKSLKDFFGLKTTIFQNLKTILGQHQDLKKKGSKDKTNLKDYITAYTTTKNLDQLA